DRPQLAATYASSPKTCSRAASPTTATAPAPEPPEVVANSTQLAASTTPDTTAVLAAWPAVRANRANGTWNTAIPTELMTTTTPPRPSGRCVRPESHSGKPADNMAQHSESTAVAAVTHRYGRSF